jgi:hypothetical protein
MTQLMVQELLNYRRSQDLTTGHESYAAGRDMERPHDDLVFCAGMVCWWGEKLARSRPNTLVMERALTNVQLNRAHSNTADRPQRPRFNPNRFTDTSEEPQSLDWDEAKHRMSRGEVDVRRPLRPERL